jgi:metallophosphoesterase (TIGR00282 family)
MSTIRILCIGDVIGAPGRAMFQKHIDRLRAELKIDAVIVNGENSDARGRGITPRIVRFFKHNGANVITSGNHIWGNKEIFEFLGTAQQDLLRPANYPRTTPGIGVTIIEVQGVKIGVINVMGRVFMHEHLDCPFRTVDSILTYLKDKTRIVVVDMHAETTSEKNALGHYLDGKVSAVVGTHTHVQTADERVLPKGTAYITDLGMTGALNSIIGMKCEPILFKFLQQMPAKFVVEEEPPFVMYGAWIEVDTATGHATRIERVKIVDDAICSKDMDAA